MDKKNLKEELREDPDELEQEDDNDNDEYDIIDELTPEQLARLQETIRQASAGNAIPHEMAMELVKALVMRGSRQNL